MSKKVLLVGGGTGGHILPLLPLCRELRDHGATVSLVMADQLLDKELAEKNFSEFPIQFLRTGKLRRYWSWQNFTDAWWTFAAVFTAWWWLGQQKPDVIFFKGGFVGVPILIAAKLRFSRARIYTHESDISAGLLTRLARKVAVKSFETYGPEPRPLFYVPEADPKPTEKTLPRILILGGSQGAKVINDTVAELAPTLVKDHELWMVCGKGKRVEYKNKNFIQHELLSAKKLSEALSGADVVISRGGSNSLCEILAAHKKSIIIPLPTVARNHQYHNAKYYADQGLCYLLEEKYLAPQTLHQAVVAVMKDELMNKKLEHLSLRPAVEQITQELLAD